MDAADAPAMNLEDVPLDAPRDASTSRDAGRDAFAQDAFVSADAFREPDAVNDAFDCRTVVERCNGIDDNCDGTVDGSVCPRIDGNDCVGFARDGREYLSCTVILDASAAEARCHDLGYEGLVSLETRVENDAVAAAGSWNDYACGLNLGHFICERRILP